ncbi:MAG: VOC family protein [Thermomicrobiales bacterium]
MKSIMPTLAVKDIDASVKFYTEVLGFSTAFTLPGEDGKLVHASIGRGDTYLMFSRLDPGHPHDQGPLGRGVVLYASVNDDDDIDAYFERAKRGGAQIMQEPTDQFWGHRDWGIADPDGYLIWVSKEMRSVSAADMAEAMLAGATS